MAYDYDFTKEAAGFPAHIPSQVDETLGTAFRSLMSLKFAMDRMEEIPKDLQGIYNQTMKAADKVAAARQETHQLQALMRRFAASHPGM